jgi:hypothetical protein
MREYMRKYRAGKKGSNIEKHGETAEVVRPTPSSFHPVPKESQLK